MILTTTGLSNADGSMWKQRILHVLLPSLIFWVFTLAVVTTVEASENPNLSGVKPHHHPTAQAEKGILLVARRGMPDPRFRQSVILLVGYDLNGAIGLIINRKSTAKLENLVPDLHGLDKQGHHVYFGGPVGIERLKFLVRSKSEPPDAVHVMDDLFISGSHEALEQMLKLDKSQKEFRIYLGYAGWGPKQLSGEIERRDWYLHKARIEDVFNNHQDSMWQELINRYDPQGELVNFRPRIDLISTVLASG